MKELEGKNVAIVAMGQSQIDFHLSQTHSVEFDEVWAINAMIGVLPNIDKAFILDPMSRFLDTEDAGSMTSMMRKKLPKCNFPIYTCELDDRCPGLVEYPLEEVVNYSNCHYLNNTVAYAVAFAYWNEVANLKMFGVDFSYKGNLHFAEAGRGCVEFWLSKCISAGMQVEVAHTSGLLDTDVPAEQKLYGYHRLKNPYIILVDEEGIKLERIDNLEIVKKTQEPVLIDRHDSHLKPVEPKKW